MVEGKRESSSHMEALKQQKKVIVVDDMGGVRERAYVCLCTER